MPIASERDRLKLLARKTADNRRDLVSTLLAARLEVEKRMLRAARDRKFATVRRVRDGVLRDIRVLYNRLQTSLDGWINRSIASTAKEFHGIAKEDLRLTEEDRSVIGFTKFSKRHFEEYHERIHPFNAERLAAVNVHLNPGLNRMLESDVRELRNAVVDVFRLAQVSGMTPEERYLELRRRVEGIAENPKSWAFIDRSGRRWKNGNYFSMLNRTVSANVARWTYNDTLIEEGRDVVQVIGGVSVNSHPACQRWNGKLLSLTGATDGFPTLAEAEGEGLHHPNCVHTEVYVSDKTADGQALREDPERRKPADVELRKPKGKEAVGKTEKELSRAV